MTIVLFYSKYSKHSERLMKMFEKNDLIRTLDVKKVGVDNSEVRKQILQNNTIDLHLVPCIVMIQANGNIEKYEGIDAFAWTDDIISRQLQTGKNQPTVDDVDITEGIPPTRQKIITNPIPQRQEERKHEIEAKFSQDSIGEKIQSQPQQLQRNGDKSEYILDPITQDMHISPQHATSLDKLDDEEFSDSQPLKERNVAFPPKRISVRSGAGSFELSNDFGQVEDREHILVNGIKQVPDINGCKEKKNVMSAALEMQKYRESLDETPTRAISSR